MEYHPNRLEAFFISLIAIPILWIGLCVLAIGGLILGAVTLLLPIWSLIDPTIISIKTKEKK